MKPWLALIFLCGCLQFQFDAPLAVSVNEYHAGEIIYEQTFTCNIDVRLQGTVQNGTVLLEITDGLSALVEETYHEMAMDFSQTYQSSAPIEVKLTLQDFNGTLKFSSSCS